MKTIELAQKRQNLCENAPDCPECGEDQQIQLKRWIGKVVWKCRKCKFSWSKQ